MLLSGVGLTLLPLGTCFVALNQSTLPLVFQTSKLNFFEHKHSVSQKKYVKVFYSFVLFPEECEYCWHIRMRADLAR
jgi:hypothetical protein